MKLLALLILTVFSFNVFADAPKYLIEIDVGKVSVPDNNKLTYDDDPNDGVGEARDTYRTSGVFALSGGARFNQISNENVSIYGLIKIKHFNGVKTDHFDSTNIDINYNDYLTSILIGPKFVFFPTSQLHLSLGLYAGLSLIRSNLDVVDANATASLESTSYSVSTEAGAEYMFNNVFGLGLTFGYEYLGKREFEVKSSSGFTTNAPTKFKSQMSYSNVYALAGLKFYFSN